MSACIHTSQRLRLRPMLLGLLCGLVAAVSATAQEAGQTDVKQTSLSLAPPNTAFYVSFHNTSRQYQRVMASVAVRRLAKEFLGQEKLTAETLSESLGDEMAQVCDWLQDPANANEAALLKDALSQEFFFLGDAGYISLLEVMREVSRRQNEMLEKLLAGGLNGAEDLDFSTEKLIPWEHIERMSVPVTLIGFKLQKPERVKPALERLEKLLRRELKDNEELAPLAERLQWTQIGGGEFLSMSVPSQQAIDLMLQDEDNESLQDLRPRLEQSLRGKTFTWSIGAKDGWLLVYAGDTNAPLEKVGNGPSLLDSEHLAPLRKGAGGPLAMVTYLSEAYAKAQQSPKDSLDNLVRMAKLYAGTRMDDEQMAARIEADSNELADDLAKWIPEPAATLAIARITDRGYNGQTWSHRVSEWYDSSRPLSLLKHVGGDPLLAGVNRVKDRTQAYRLLTKWLDRGAWYLERLSGQKANDDETTPGKRLNEALSKKILPALRDGESAFVIDAKLQTRQLQTYLPESPEPRAVLEPAWVWSVSDAELLKSGLRDLREIINDTLVKLSGDRDQAPSLPPPARRDVDAGAVHFYELPQALGVDPQIAPSLALSERVAALAASQGHAERLLKPTEPQLGGLAQKADRPLAAASYLNFAGLVRVASPWILDFARASAQREAVGAEDADAKEDGKAKAQDPERTLRRARLTLDVLQCFRTLEGVAYEKDGAMVGEFEMTFEDLKP